MIFIGIKSLSLVLPLPEVKTGGWQFIYLRQWRIAINKRLTFWIDSSNNSAVGADGN